MMTTVDMVKQNQNFYDNKFDPIYFYIRDDKIFDTLPKSSSDYWDWRVRNSKKYNSLGKFDWTLQTYLHLRDNSFPCRLVTAPPAKGIILAHKDFLEDIVMPNQGTMLVCLKSDRSPHTHAQIHVVQNPADKVETHQEQFVSSVFIPHWVQPMLISRNLNRGRKFENIGYIGGDFELSEVLKEKSWEYTLRQLGFNWIKKTTPDKWSDFSDIDALVSIRKCYNKSEEFKFKPATKLYNAWHAGVPAILGIESAYRAERKNKFDYLEVNTPQEIINALLLLRNNADLIDLMVSNGKTRAEETKSAALIRKWEDFLINISIPAYLKWCSSNWIRKKFIVKGILRYAYFRIKCKVMRKNKFAYGY